MCVEPRMLFAALVLYDGDAPDTRLEVRPFPYSRRMVIDGCEWERKKHIIHSLAEFDVTRAREIIRQHKKATGQALSFSAFIAACLGRAVAEDRVCHAYRHGRKLLLFQDVDVATLVERDVEGARLATFYVIRAADRKTPREIHHEIRSAQQENIATSKDLSRWKLFVRLPALARHIFYRLLDRSPLLRKRLGGTVVLTAVGMAGGGGWGIPISTTTLTVVIGGIEIKPGVVDGRIEPREYLCVTASFDHDIVDGVPAASFVSRFRAYVERAYGLQEFATEDETAALQ